VVATMGASRVSERKQFTSVAFRYSKESILKNDLQFGVDLHC
jgi:KaiC/GvpD/RAD55 family RecA-like ATPase